MVKIKITADNPALQELAAAVKKIGRSDILPATDATFQGCAKMVADSWRAYGQGQKDIPGVPPMKKPSSNYSGGVKVKKSAPLEYTISNESKAAPLLEYGTDGYDMKTTHPYGKKSRVSKQKNPKTKMIELIPYLIVPFSWGTPGTVTFQNTMTEDIYAIAERMKKSVVMEETHFEENWAGEAIERHEYTWADRLNENDLGNADGMVRMSDTPTGKSTYWTFRIISAKSPKNSWINKGIPARNVTEGLKALHEKEIADAIQNALATDLG
ncbi:hypothetical protein DWQ65_02375 [Treponema phagedenis]|uniref:Uncharacterized protein n=2 Tax=Treponema phagedenis TaxID=162 RepID=A0A0B7GXL2_TREPH|nr:hypothetical protein [Treponema phagedenis]NVP23038.1 hypothetical protein [Treponema phagedenis]NVP23497.1 hypothetical protein [Treponema phagedenis]QEJ94671.1 hypothetical protein FUT79_05270 [Treponema phagedenis]QEJ95206.1 hypothetical protein FUT79_08345 [Treponema phagedenis]QEJ95817.1 hypothetical protein FUT79_11825 [Treponema phagedenis]